MTKDGIERIGQLEAQLLAANERVKELEKQLANLEGELITAHMIGFEKGKDSSRDPK